MKALILLSFLLFVPASVSADPPAGTSPGSNKQAPPDPKEPAPSPGKLKKAKTPDKQDDPRKVVEDVQDEKK